MRKKNDRSGSALVEFSLTLPIALLFLFGAIDMARANFLRHTAKTAAYEGARQGAIEGGTEAAITERVSEVMRMVGVRGTTATVTPPILTDATTEVTVKVSVPMSRNLWGMTHFFHGATLEQSCTLTRDTAQSGY